MSIILYGTFWFLEASILTKAYNSRFVTVSVGGGGGANFQNKVNVLIKVINGQSPQTLFLRASDEVHPALWKARVWFMRLSSADG